MLTLYDSSSMQSHHKIFKVLGGHCRLVLNKIIFHKNIFQKKKKKQKQQKYFFYYCTFKDSFNVNDSSVSVQVTHKYACMGCRKQEFSSYFQDLNEVYNSQSHKKTRRQVLYQIKSNQIKSLYRTKCHPPLVNDINVF